MATLNRVLASANLEANIYYKGVEAVNNGFDAKIPWSEIEEITDENGNVWIKIPKFYTKYVIEDGVIKERYISEYNCGKEWHLNPIFIKNNGTEADHFLVSKYLLGLENGKVCSKSGLAPYTEVSAVAARAAANEYDKSDTSGYEYSLFDIWALIALQDLCLIEFAASDVTSIIQGRTNSNYKSNLTASGDLDTIGTNVASGSSSISAAKDEGLYCMKYRGIENLWGNGRTFVDGICYYNNKIWYTSNSANYGDYDKYTESDIAFATSNGYVHQLGFDANSCLVLPAVTDTSSGSYGDYCSTPTTQTGRRIFYIGNERSGGENGLFSFINATATGTLDYSVFRMIKKPD